MTTHHALLYTTPDRSRVLSHIYATAEDAECITYTVDTLSIGEVRRIIEQAYQKPGNHTYRLIVLNVRMIAPEAQHALLKIIEEPPATTRFAFIVSSVAGLLPTVLSRVQVIGDDSVASGETSALRDFLDLTIPERLAYIADVAKKKDDATFDDLYMNLLVYLGSVSADDMYSIKAAIGPLLPYLRMRGASKKMLWEEIAFTLPVAK